MSEPVKKEKKKHIKVFHVLPTDVWEELPSNSKFIPNF